MSSLSCPSSSSVSFVLFSIERSSILTQTVQSNSRKLPISSFSSQLGAPYLWISAESYINPRSRSIQQIPNVSPYNAYTTIIPLALVLIVAAIKDFQEDLVRYTLTEQVRIDTEPSDANRNDINPTEASTAGKQEC